MQEKAKEAGGLRPVVITTCHSLGRVRYRQSSRTPSVWLPQSR